MRSFYFLTIHPAIIGAYSQFGVYRAAQDKGVARLEAIDLRDFAVDRHASVDAPPYGGGDGMVMRPEPLAAAVGSLPQKPLVILTTPAAPLWTQAKARHYAAEERSLAFVCGRFGGIDQRFIDLYVDEAYSIGDVVLAGGELPAMAMAESILRLMPGVLGHGDSASKDSLMPAYDYGLEHPLYTRPPEFCGLSVPKVLLSGDHAAIEAWRREEAKRRTQRIRPDLLIEGPSARPQRS